MRGPHNILAADPHRRDSGPDRRDGRRDWTRWTRPGLVRVARCAFLVWPFAVAGRTRVTPSMPPATRALTALGPAYIKFGQILSTRPDLVGEELADAITGAAGQAAAIFRQTWPRPSVRETELGRIR